MSEIKELTEKVKRFRDERDWEQFHNHKDLALSLVLEAAEVLEHFQWKADLEEIEKYGKDGKEEIADELADVAAYLFELADSLDIDLGEALENKLKKSAEKYPVDKAKGNKTKYTKL
ncbi:MAG: nucleotide pyrophosphohydrolase [Patescibacteria group bacterium]